MNRLVILLLVAIAMAMLTAPTEGIITFNTSFFLKLQMSYSHRKSDIIYMETFQQAYWLRTRQLITSGAEKWQFT